MTVRGNSAVIESIGNKKLFLLDASAIILIEELSRMVGIDTLGKIQDSSTHYFFISNEVYCEVSRNCADFFDAHSNCILNAEGSTAHRKLSTIPIEIEGEMRVMTINNISHEDWNQIWLCRNHMQLTLVTNDKKLIKSAAIVIGERVINPKRFMMDFISAQSDADLTIKVCDIINSWKEKSV